MQADVLLIFDTQRWRLRRHLDGKNNVLKYAILFLALAAILNPISPTKAWAPLALEEKALGTRLIYTPEKFESASIGQIYLRNITASFWVFPSKLSATFCRKPKDLDEE